MPKKWQQLLNMRKLRNKDLEYCKDLLKQWYKIKTICRMFNVSNGYLYYYWIRK